MSHVGIVAEPIPGHLNPACTIGRELVARGHRVTVFAIADLAGAIVASGLEHCVIGETDFPPGALDRWRSPARTRGLRALVESIRLHVDETRMLCRDVPDAVKGLDIDLLLVDQLQVCGRYIAESTGRPFVTVCAGPGLLRTGDDRFPPPFVPWGPATGVVGRLVNKVAFASMWLAAAPRLRVTNRFAREVGFAPNHRIANVSSRVLHVSSLVTEMNFGVDPPSGSPQRYFGPLVDSQRPHDDFPWERLDGRPLVYASLGTIQEGADDIFGAIAEACAGLDVQLVVALGDDRGRRLMPALAGDPIVVAHAPQLELLELAALCITHCGMNTTMETAGLGVPMVGIPIIYDQPAVAARIRHAGVGVTIPAKRLTVDGLRTAITTVLNDPAYRERAAAVAESCSAAGGVRAAVDAIEYLLRSG